MAVNLDDYVDVAERIAGFRELHPTGSLQPADPAKPYELVEVGGKTFIVYVAAAYRSPEDLLPGIGCAWEPVPGKTPYTRDSELMNAETSAWGRAIIAVLAADSRRGVASREEVRNRAEASAASAASPSTSEASPPDAFDDLVALATAQGTKAELHDFLGHPHTETEARVNWTAMTDDEREKARAIAAGGK